MKKIFILFIMFFILGIACGYLVYMNKMPKQDIEQYLMISDEQKINNTSMNEINKIEDEYILQTSSHEKCLSPNAVLVLKKYYKACGHTIMDESIIPEEAINKNANEIKEMYNKWELVSFEPHEVILYKEYEGTCNEHFVLRNKDNFIIIYTIDDNGKEKLYEKTAISTKYLTTEDLKKLNDGIKAIGKEELNSILEDYE